MTCHVFPWLISVNGFDVESVTKSIQAYGWGLPVGGGGADTANRGLEYKYKTVEMNFTTDLSVESVLSSTSKIDRKAILTP